MRIDASRFASMAANPKAAEGADVAREFEAMLLATVWKQAAAPIGVSGLLSGGSSARMYREMLIDEVARRAASAELGLAKQLTLRAEDADRAEPEEASDG